MAALYRRLDASFAAVLATTTPAPQVALTPAEQDDAEYARHIVWMERAQAAARAR